MARGKSKGKYPDDYGTNSKALPNFASPLRVHAEGDKLVPENDMAQIGGTFATGGECPDPLGVLKGFGNGTKKS